jgi:hypothetical protein
MRAGLLRPDRNRPHGGLQVPIESYGGSAMLLVRQAASRSGRFRTSGAAEIDGLTSDRSPC